MHPPRPIDRLLGRVVGFCARRAWLVVALGLLLAGASGWLAAARLGVTTDVDGLFAASLPWKQREAALKREFPQFEDLIVAVVDGAAPEETEETAAALAETLGRETALFRSVRRPDASPYLEREGLLFLPQDELGPLLDQLVDAQPFLGQLAADPSARGLFGALSLVAEGVRRGQAQLGPFAPALGAFERTLRAAEAGPAPPLSWQNLLAGPVTRLAGPSRFVLLQPVLDYQSVQPGGAATARLREVAAGLPWVRAGLAQVHVTGSVPLADEEFASAARGAITGLVLSFALVLVWLFLAVRTTRQIVPIVLTLLLGLVLTTGASALMVGTLNLISVAFAILFVGIAVDFAIQFTVRFRDAHRGTVAVQEALGNTGRRVGLQILVASAATAAGFLAFVPTSFEGVAELGLIAGVGMLIAFICTVTFLPACLSIASPAQEPGEVGFGWAAPLDRALARSHGWVMVLFGVVFAIGAALTPGLRFDSNTLHTKDQNSEAVRTLLRLLDTPLTNPFTINIVRPSVADAAALAPALQRLPLVDHTVNVEDLVPADQAAKLPLIADAASLLATTIGAAPSAPPVTAEALRRAAADCASKLATIRGQLKTGDALLGIADALARLARGDDAALLRTNEALTRFLPRTLAMLRTSLGARAATLADVPADLRRDYVLPDGRARIEVVPKSAVADSRKLHDFVVQVQSVAPDAGGAAVSIVATSDTILNAFRHAAQYAVVAIGVILLASLRHVRDASMVLAALLLSAAETVIVVRLAGMQLNYANVIALPLLLGVGVSFNIYFVMNWRAGERSRLASPTTRAVIFSALTTATAFGSLAVSGHPGTASMGTLLLISLGCTLVTTLVFVPALLATVRRS